MKDVSAMKLIRYCGKERLPGGERLWRRLAKEAGFTGVLRVYGYGAAGDRKVVDSQRAYERGTPSKYYGRKIIVGLHTTGEGLEVWLPCTCQTALEDSFMNPNLALHAADGQPKWLPVRYEALFVFAHELGHYQQEMESTLYSERGATNRGNHLLEKVCRTLKPQTE